MRLFSTTKRLAIEGTEAWVVSAGHCGSLLDLVFHNRLGEIWLFNNNLDFFKRKSLFESIYLTKIVKELGNRVSAVKVIVDSNESDIFSGQTDWFDARRQEFESFVRTNNCVKRPRFLFAPISQVISDRPIGKLFGANGPPPGHTWIFYLHGDSLKWQKQHGMALFRPSEFPFGGKDSLVLSWHLSDRAIMNDDQREAFDDCFGHDTVFKELLGDGNLPIEEQHTQARTEDIQHVDGLAFGEPCDVLVLTPATDEMTYFRKRFEGRLHRLQTPGALDCYGLVSKANHRAVIFARTGEGNIAAGIATAQFLQLFRPKHVVLVGVAGAIRSISSRHTWKIGDVVIGQTTYDYEWGEVKDSGCMWRRGWSFEPKSDICTDWGGEMFDRHLYARASTKADDNWSLTAKEIKAHLSLVVRPDKLEEVSKHVDVCVKEPIVAHLGLIGSGSKVVASPIFAQIVIKRKSNKISAVETEAAGVSHACSLHDEKLDYLIVRGIMDLADSKSRSPEIRKSYRHIAKIACGCFVSDLIDDF